MDMRECAWVQHLALCLRIVICMLMIPACPSELGLPWGPSCPLKSALTIFLLLLSSAPGRRSLAGRLRTNRRCCVREPQIHASSETSSAAAFLSKFHSR
uniref:Secreted protein n=1 Tax=Knipowitschia caucasica TaxID=637954 RepID=A0AAV2LK38_KNICA